MEWTYHPIHVFILCILSLSSLIFSNYSFLKAFSNSSIPTLISNGSIINTLVGKPFHVAETKTDGSLPNIVNISIFNITYPINASNYVFDVDGKDIVTSYVKSTMSKPFNYKFVEMINVGVTK